MADERILPTPGPTDRPTFTIFVNGRELSREHHVISLSVTKLVNRIASAKIVVMDGDPAAGDFQVSNADLFVPGREIEIHAGYHCQEASIFKGIVIRHGLRTRQEKPPCLIVECRHKAVLLSVGRRDAYYHDSTDSDVLRAVIDKCSIDSTIDATDVRHKELVQYGCTDWDFIVSRAEVNGRLVLTNDAGIRIVKPRFSANPAASLVYGATMFEFDAEMDARDQVSSVQSRTWDAAAGQVLTADAEDPKVTAPGDIDPAALAAAVDGQGAALTHCALSSDAELKAWADARLLRSRLAKVCGRVRAQGLPSVNPGDMIEIGGVGRRFNGRAFVSGVRHEIGAGLWTTDMQFGLPADWFMDEFDVPARPASGLLPAVSGLQIGVVVRLQDDPDAQDRVRVRMPLVDKADEGVWARVATLDAGAGRGSFFRPEIGDEVVLGFLNDDPRDPVILGMLNSSARPAPLQARDENPEKGFVTRSGMKLLFDDDKKKIVVETPAGKTIALSEEDGTITLKDENSRIEMSSDGILMESGADLTLKAAGDIVVEGVNVTHKAGAQFKAEGTSGAELSTAASAVVKGSMVQIN
jgi:Rhs element Vgr protein